MPARLEKAYLNGDQRHTFFTERAGIINYAPTVGVRRCLRDSPLIRFPVLGYKADVHSFG